MDTETPALNATQSVLLRAIRRVLRPLVRLMLKNGITYPMVLEDLKQLFVEVAEAEFKLEGKAQTDSRLTVLTGVHRKDVKRIRDQNSGDCQFQSVNLKPNLGAQVVAQWLGNPLFLTSNDLPLALPRTGPSDQANFDALVGMVSKDVRARPLLDEWLRTGIVKLDANGLVVLNRDAFIPADDLEQSVEFLAMNVHDHLAAAVNNLDPKSQRLFERCAFDDNLSAEQVQALHDYVRKHGMDFLRSVNKQSVKLEKTPQVSEPHYRVNTGVYFYFSSETRNDNHDSQD
ncbi:MAG: DUF6502 family protein [Limnobacter sp.]|nr:DUF6502 family protein [Limnobacter sp.]